MEEAGNPEIVTDDAVTETDNDAFSVAPALNLTVVEPAPTKLIWTVPEPSDIDGLPTVTILSLLETTVNGSEPRFP